MHALQKLIMKNNLTMVLVSPMRSSNKLVLVSSASLGKNNLFWVLVKQVWCSSYAKLPKPNVAFTTYL